MFCPLSALAELAASELQSGEDFSGHPTDDTSCASSSRPVLPVKKRPRTTGGSSGSPRRTTRRSSATAKEEEPFFIEEQNTCVDYKAFFSPSFKPFKMTTKKPRFPVILMAIMTAPHNEKFISFLSDHQSFIIINPEALSTQILPVHFENNVPSFEQFVDVLATWGFRVEKSDPQFPNVAVYRHGLFRRGDWESCLKMEKPSVSEISANRLQYRNTFQALGENVVVGTEDYQFNGSSSLKHEVTPKESEEEKSNSHPQDLFTSRANSFLFTNPASSLKQMSRRQSLPFSTARVGSEMKEDEITSATDEVVSAAMAALHCHGGDAKETHYFRRHSIDYDRNVPSDHKVQIAPHSSQLDFITEVFLERSMARKLQSRRDTGLGPNLGMTGFLAMTSSCERQSVTNINL